MAKRRNYQANTIRLASDAGLKRTDYIGALAAASYESAEAPASAEPFSRLPHATRQRWSGAGLRTVLKIAQLWGITDEALRRVIGSPSRRSWKRWVGRARSGQHFALTERLLLRLGTVLSIYGALRTEHAGDDEALAWLTGPHGSLPFGGATPMSMLLGGLRHHQEQLLSFLRAAGTGIYMPPTEAKFERASVAYDLVFI